MLKSEIESHSSLISHDLATKAHVMTINFHPRHSTCQAVWQNGNEYNDVQVCGKNLNMELSYVALQT